MEQTELTAHGGNPPASDSREQERYTLPPWRMNQIILEVISALNDAEYYSEHFDYMQMIQCVGIKIKRFSSFSPENLEQFRQISLSLWNEGVYIMFPDEQTNEPCRMIAYNDNHTASEIMQIILHEFAHYRLKHTQQSINGETEAACFAVVMSFMLMLEAEFHIGRKIMQAGGKQFLLRTIKTRMEEKEVL